jgi:hypothetical protein
VRGRAADRHRVRELPRRAGLRAEASEAARDGFTGKMAIHPSQVEVINEVFTPTAEQVAVSEEIVKAFADNRKPACSASGAKWWIAPTLPVPSASWPAPRPSGRGEEALSSRALCPGSIYQQRSAFVDGWIPVTSTG